MPGWADFIQEPSRARPGIGFCEAVEPDKSCKEGGEMTLVQAIVYGVVQGLGEFLPISHSAHLILVPWFFGWTDPGLTFDVALHVGTLFAVIAYFWKDWVQLILKGFTERYPLRRPPFLVSRRCHHTGRHSRIPSGEKGRNSLPCASAHRDHVDLHGSRALRGRSLGLKKEEYEDHHLPGESLDRPMPDGCHYSGRLALGCDDDGRAIGRAQP